MPGQRTSGQRASGQRTFGQRTAWMQHPLIRLGEPSPTICDMQQTCYATRSLCRLGTICTDKPTRSGMMLSARTPTWLALTAIVSLCWILSPAACGGDDDSNAASTNEVCIKGWTKCGDMCFDLSAHPDNCGACGSACSISEVCSRGTCGEQCHPGLEKCGRSCTDVQANNEHCGACDAACDAGLVCLRGECVSACPSGLTQCGGGCVSPASHVLHCGECVTHCHPGQVCSLGECVDACDEGLDDCNGACVDVATDVLNCSACGNKCESGTLCGGGECLEGCPEGLMECVSGCVDLDSSVMHCGGCGDWCKSGRECTDGVCRGGVPCSGGLTDCGDGCFDTMNDPEHCGGCSEEHRCFSDGLNQTAVCHAGECRTMCQYGYGACGDQAGCGTDLRIDKDNCGYCGNSCPVYGPGDVAVCDNGKCDIDCEFGYKDCDEQPGCEANTDDDVQNCGGCGNGCVGGSTESPVCIAGECFTNCNAGWGNCGGESGCETNLQTSMQHCGGCGNECLVGINQVSTSCQGGHCIATCQPGWGDCDEESGCETRVESNNEHCGGCGIKCPAEDIPHLLGTCNGDQCSMSCSSPYFQCLPDIACVEKCE